MPLRLGRYCHIADSYHIYGKDLPEFEARFLGAIKKRTFEQRTLRYEDVKPIMDEARPAILEKVEKMGRPR
jgi:thymidylate synthase